MKVAPYHRYKFSHRKLEQIIAMLHGNNVQVTTLENLPNSARGFRVRVIKNANGTVTLEGIDPISNKENKKI